MFISIIQFVISIVLVLTLAGTPVNTTSSSTPSTTPTPATTLAPEAPETLPDEDLPLADLPDTPAETAPALPEGATVDVDGIHVIDEEGNPIGALFVNEDGSEVFMPY